MDVENDTNSIYLSDEIKWGIVISRKYYKEKYNDIMDMYNLSSKGTISKILKKYEETGSVNNLFTGPGSYSKQSEELIASIDKLIQSNPKSTETLIYRKLKEEDISVSTWLIAKIRRQLGYKKSKIRLKPHLNQNHKDKRVEYCKEMVNDNMSNIIFSDECIFALNNDCSTVWYRPGEEKMARELINPAVKLHVWGSISRRGKFSLYWHESSVNADVYMDCLKEFIPEVNKRYGRHKWRFQQDWAGSHRPKKVKDLILKDVYAIMNHPSVSPDLNPIEKVWSWMKRKINYWSPTNKDELEYCIESAWNLLNNDKINNFIDHMYNIMPRIISSGGEMLD